MVRIVCKLFIPFSQVFAQMKGQQRKFGVGKFACQLSVVHHLEPECYFDWLGKLSWMAFNSVSLETLGGGGGGGAFGSVIPIPGKRSLSRSSCSFIKASSI